MPSNPLVPRLEPTASKCLRLGIALLAIGALAPRASAQSVHVVDASGATGSFTSIQSAIDAAADGDLLLVEPGTYGKFVLDGKGLTIVADGNGVLFKSTSPSGQPSSGFDIVNLPAGSAVNLAGIEMVGGSFFVCATAMRVEDCLGPVQIRDCTIAARFEPPTFPSTTSALEIYDSSAVSIVDSDIDATEAYQIIFDCEDSAHALQSESSNVFVHGGTVSSGVGYIGDGLCPPHTGGDGPAGWTLTGGFGLGSRVALSGGQGGDGNFYAPPVCGRGGPGGAGLLLLPTGGPVVESPSFVRSSMTAVPGDGGEGALTCSPGPSGVDVAVVAGSVVADDFAPRTLETPFLVREGTVKPETYVGEPFDLVWHVFGAVPAAPVFVPELTGAQTVGTPYFIRFRGPLPASGSKTVNLLVPELNLDFVTIYEEAYFYDGRRFYLSNPRFSVLLDDGF